MDAARDAILACIRRISMAGSATETDARLQSHARGPQPRLLGDPIELFTAGVMAAAGTIEETRSPAELAEAVGRYLTRHGLPAAVVLAPHPLLADIPWPESMRAERRSLAPTDLTAVTVAFAGIAETGSLVLLSGPETPTRINFLPDNLICVLHADRVVPYLEDAWQLIRAQIGIGPGMLPRTVNLVTGPSRTADVEQTVQLGAHGPRRLHVMLWKSQKNGP